MKLISAQARSVQQGFTLIDALIGMVILSVGLLSVVALQTELISSTGLSKARSEAMQIAESEIETMRNFIIKESADDPDFTPNHDYDFFGFNDIVADERPEGGVNAKFSLGRNVQNIGNDLLRLNVEVSWADPKAEDPEVLWLGSFVNWNNPSSGALLASYDSLGGNLGQSPTGQAYRGGQKYDPNDLPENVIDPLDAFSDYEIRETADGATELIRLSDGQVVLTDPYGGKFYSIEGMFYKSSPKKNKDLYLMISDGAFCLTDDGSAATLGDQTGYECFVGLGWTGNIGASSVQESVPVCVGDPAESYDGTFASRDARATNVRIYRGYSNSRFVGIGVDQSDGFEGYDGQDFLLFEGNTNNIEPGDCETQLREYAEATGVSFAGNSGVGVCFTAENTCPKNLVDPYRDYYY